MFSLKHRESDLISLERSNVDQYISNAHQVILIWARLHTATWSTC